MLRHMVNSESNDTLREVLRELERCKGIIRGLLDSESEAFKDKTRTLNLRELATLKFVQAEGEVDGEVSSSEWESILGYWRVGGVSYAKTQASVSLVLTELMRIGALEEIDGSGASGSRIMQITSEGIALLEQGMPRLEKSNKRAKRKGVQRTHERWTSEDDLRLLESAKKYRLNFDFPIIIPEEEIAEWAVHHKRSKWAITSRINKYDQFKKSYRDFEVDEYVIIEDIKKRDMTKKEQIRHLSGKLERSPQVIAVMIDKISKSADKAQ